MKDDGVDNRGRLATHNIEQQSLERTKIVHEVGTACDRASGKSVSEGVLPSFPRYH